MSIVERVTLEGYLVFAKFFSAFSKKNAKRDKDDFLIVINFLFLLVIH